MGWELLYLERVKDLILTNLFTLGGRAKTLQGRRRAALGEIPVALRAPSISPDPLTPPRSKEDTSTLVRIGHFYFGLTVIPKDLDIPCPVEYPLAKGGRTFVAINNLPAFSRGQQDLLTNHCHDKD